MLYVILTLTISLVLGFAFGRIPTSPCPALFTYESEPENDRWYGVVMFTPNIELAGLNLRVTLDRSAHLLVSWDGEVRSRDNSVFIIFNPYHFQRAGEKTKLRIMVKYNSRSQMPLLKSLTLNGNIVCPTESSAIALNSVDNNSGPTSSTERYDPAFNNNNYYPNPSEDISGIASEFANKGSGSTEITDNNNGENYPNSGNGDSSSGWTVNQSHQTNSNRPQDKNDNFYDVNSRPQSQNSRPQKGGSSSQNSRPESNANNQNSFSNSRPESNANNQNSFSNSRPESNANNQNSFSNSRPESNANNQNSISNSRPESNANNQNSFSNSRPESNANNQYSISNSRPESNANNQNSFSNSRPESNANSYGNKPNAQNAYSNNRQESSSFENINNNSNERQSSQTQSPNQNNNNRNTNNNWSDISVNTPIVTTLTIPANIPNNSGIAGTNINQIVEIIRTQLAQQQSVGGGNNTVVVALVQESPQKNLAVTSTPVPPSTSKSNGKPVTSAPTATTRKRN